MKRRLVNVVTPNKRLCQVVSCERERVLLSPVHMLATYEVTDGDGTRLEVHPLILRDGELVDSWPLPLRSCEVCLGCLMAPGGIPTTVSREQHRSRICDSPE